MSSVVKVGIADMNVVTAPGSIRTAGLGSCVGVVIYDEVKQIAGLAHVMLPDSTMMKAGIINPCKYADTAIEKLLSMLTKKGASYRLKAKMAGGAEMFQFTSTNEMIRIGPRNVEAVKQQLRKFRIPIISEDCGGNSGRTIEFYTETNMLMVRTVKQGVKEI